MRLIALVCILSFCCAVPLPVEAGHGGRAKKILSAPVRLVKKVHENRQAARSERGGLFGICR